MIVKYFVEQEDSKTKEKQTPKFLFFREIGVVKQHDPVEYEDVFYQVVLLEHDSWDNNVINAFCHEVTSTNQKHMQ